MIITLTGQNSFGRLRALEELQQKFVQEHGSVGLERLAGDDIDMGRLLDMLQAGNLFAPERLIVIRDVSQNKPIAERIDEVLASVGAGVTLVLHEPNLDMRTSFAKTLQKQTDFKKFDQLKEFELGTWLRAEVAERGGIIDQAAASYLLQRVGPNQQALSQEIEKILAYDKTISRQTVELLTSSSPQSSIFELLSAAFDGRRERMLALYHEQLAQGMDPGAILSMVAWQLHVFVVVKAGVGRSPDEIAKQAGLSPYVVKNAAGVVRSLAMHRLKELMQLVIDLEVTAKSKAINMDDAVQMVLLKIAS